MYQNNVYFLFIARCSGKYIMTIYIYKKYCTSKRQREKEGEKRRKRNSKECGQKTLV